MGTLAYRCISWVRLALLVSLSFSPHPSTCYSRSSKVECRGPSPRPRGRWPDLFSPFTENWGKTLSLYCRGFAHLRMSPRSCPRSSLTVCSPASLPSPPVLVPGWNVSALLQRDSPKIKPVERWACQLSGRLLPLSSRQERHLLATRWQLLVSACLSCRSWPVQTPRGATLFLYRSLILAGFQHSAWTVSVADYKKE